MGRVVEYRWPAADTDNICALQNTAGAANLVLNGDIPNSNQGYAVWTGFSRVISLTSLNNLTAAQFTITGTYRNATVSETRSGPNANTVQTTQLFDSVSSISVNGAVNGVSAGLGTTGQTHWFLGNPFATVVDLQIQVVVTGTINYTFETTLDDIQVNATPTVFTPIVQLTAVTTTQLATYSAPDRYSHIKINSATDGTLVATFLRQGVI